MRRRCKKRKRPEERRMRRRWKGSRRRCKEEDEEWEEEEEQEEGREERCISRIHSPRLSKTAEPNRTSSLIQVLHEDPSSQDHSTGRGTLLERRFWKEPEDAQTDSLIVPALENPLEPQRKIVRDQFNNSSLTGSSFI